MNFDWSDADKALWKRIDEIVEEHGPADAPEDVHRLGEALAAAGYPGPGALGPAVVAAQKRLAARLPVTFLALEGIRMGTDEKALDRIQVSASLGIMQRVFEAATAHAKGTREDGKKLIGRQEYGFRLAEMLTLLQTAELLAYRAAWMAEAGIHEAPTLAACAKVFCTETAAEVASSALDILGPSAPAYVEVEGGWRLAKRLQLTGTTCVRALSEIGDGVIRKET